MKPRTPIHIHIDRLALPGPPRGGESRLREDIRAELARVVSADFRGKAPQPRTQVRVPARTQRDLSSSRSTARLLAQELRRSWIQH